MAKKIRFRRPVVVIFWAVMLLLVILMIESAFQYRKVGAININIQGQEDVLFLDSLEIIRLLNGRNKEKLKKLSFRQISIRNLESRVESNLFVDDCEIARNYRGDLFVDVALAQPIARFVRSDKPDFYIDQQGKLMPILDRRTAKVLLVTRVKDGLPNFEKADHNLLILINKINKDPFLRAMVAQIDIQKNREIILYPQVGKQIFDFGKCYQIKDKLKKFKVFYKEILRRKGWEAYNKVTLKYDQQIICE